MAFIDHTTLLFKNGRPITDINYRSLPFVLDVDGTITALKDREIQFDCISNKRYIYYMREKIAYNICKLLRVTNLIDTYYNIQYKKYISNDNKIMIFEYISDDYNVSFLVNEQLQSTYIILSGYGHYKNPYTHFINRGLPKSIERKIYKESYEWLISHVLEDILSVFTIADQDSEKILKYFQKPIDNHKLL